MTKVLLDLDGTIINFVGGALLAHGVTANPYDDPRNHGVWDVVGLIRMQPEKFWKKMGFDFWLSLDWLPDGKDILRMVEARYGAENIALCTSPCDTEGCMDGKRAWIRGHLPQYRKRFVFTQAKEVLAGQRTLLIDDCDANVDKFREAGGQTILVPRPWNRNHELSDRTLRVMSLFLED